MLFSLLLGLFLALPFLALKCLEQSPCSGEKTDSSKLEPGPRTGSPSSTADSTGPQEKSLLLSGTLSPAALHNFWDGFFPWGGEGFQDQITCRGHCKQEASFRREWLVPVFLVDGLCMMRGQSQNSRGAGALVPTLPHMMEDITPARGPSYSPVPSALCPPAGCSQQHPHRQQCTPI